MRSTMKKRCRTKRSGKNDRSSRSSLRTCAKMSTTPETKRPLKIAKVKANVTGFATKNVTAIGTQPAIQAGTKPVTVTGMKTVTLSGMKPVTKTGTNHATAIGMKPAT